MDSWIMTLIAEAGYLGIFLLMLAETVFPPIPSEVIMPLAGVSAASGKLDLGLVILAGSAGAMLGNVLWFLLARAVGLPRFRLLIRRYGTWLAIGWPDVTRMNRIFARFGAPIVMIGRVLPTIRTLISLPAGVSRMGLSSFLVWSSLGTIAWSSGLAAAGWLLGKNVARVEEVIAPIASLIVVLIIAAYIWKQLTFRFRRTTIARAAAKEDCGDVARH